MDPAVSIDHLDFGYEETLILKDVSLKIEQGEYIGIFGPNGGGKTTLLKLIMGFLEPARGSISILGKTAEEAQGQMAYVPQKLSFDPQFPISVLELVLSGRLSRLTWYGVYRKEDREAARLALESVGMEQFAGKAFGTLSGGQAQRVLIARALVSNPRLLLLDEPTAGVDAKAEDEIYQILEDLKGTITILMVTHQLTTALSRVDRVFCVQREVQSLKPEELCEHFAIGLYHPPLTPSQEEGAP